MFYLIKTPGILKKLYPECVWEVQTIEKIAYLTFDDGPHPDVTPFVLEQLKEHSAKATFFCIGKNVQENFDQYKEIVSAGHAVGNHTFNHLNGWKTPDRNYIEDVRKAADIIDSTLFRPPYGRITRFQIKALQGEQLKLKTIMWDVLSGDFDEKVSSDNCYLNVVKNVRPGSIIVFHDSLKAFPRLQFALPRVLDFFAEKGFRFEAIPRGI